MFKNIKLWLHEGSIIINQAIYEIQKCNIVQDSIVRFILSFLNMKKVKKYIYFFYFLQSKYFVKSGISVQR